MMPKGSNGTTGNVEDSVRLQKMTRANSLTTPEGTHLRTAEPSVHTHTFNYGYCCGKRINQLGLVEGVTSECDYRRFARHCSIIFLCVRASVLPATASRVETVPAVLQKGEAAENSLMTLCIIPPGLSFTPSLSLCCIEEY